MFITWETILGPFWVRIEDDKVVQRCADLVSLGFEPEVTMDEPVVRWKYSGAGKE